MRVLAVDDDSVARLFLKTTLAKLGHQVVEASDGEDAWQLYQTFEFEAVIVDWMMPNVDGLELCKRIRAAERQKYTYVIMLTARKGKQSYLEGMAAGADDFVSKPVGTDELAARLHVAERIVGLKAEVRKLQGMIPICSYCKKIRSDDDSWQQIEAYVATRTDASFSHGICPDCYDSKVIPQIDELEAESAQKE